MLIKRVLDRVQTHYNVYINAIVTEFFLDCSVTNTNINPYAISFKQ